MLIKRFCLKLNIFCIIVFRILNAFFLLVSFSFKKHQIITTLIKTEWLRSHNPDCGYLVLIFEKLEKFRFFSRCIKGRVFDLFTIQNTYRNFIFFISSRTFHLRMSKPSEFFENELWPVTSDYDIKKKYRKEENLGKQESKCIQKDFLVPIYKIILPKMSTLDKQWENLGKSFNFADMNFYRWPISRNFVDDIFWKMLWSYVFVEKGQKFAKSQKYLLT